MKTILAVLLSLLLFNPPVFAAQEADRTKMSKSHQRVYDASLALYGELGEVGHFLCTTTVIDKAAGQYLLLTAGHCITGEGLPDGIKFYVSEQIVDQPIIGNKNLQPVEVLRAENDE